MLPLDRRQDEPSRDQALSPARGLNLTTELMQTCDADLSLLASWFSGRQLDMSPPINVSVNSVATDAFGNPTQFIGGHWVGALVVPLQVTINIGDLPMASGTATASSSNAARRGLAPRRTHNHKSKA